MRTGRVLIAVLAVIWALHACKKEPVGFLQTEYAGYAPDSMIVKSVLDTSVVEQPNELYDLLLTIGYTPAQLADPKTKIPFFETPVHPTIRVPNNDPDFQRHQFHIPWITIPIQGLRGTFPLLITVNRVTSTSPDAEKLKQMIHIRGSSGIMEIPFDHGLAPGRYVISLRCSNEGWVKDMDNVFTFIVE